MVVTLAVSLSQSAGFLMLTLVADRLFDVRTHNGFVSMVSKRTGEHRTFRVWTQSEESDFITQYILLLLFVFEDREVVLVDNLRLFFPLLNKVLKTNVDTVLVHRYTLF